MDAHIFIDNSNAFGGAQRAAGTHEPEAVWLAVRLYYRNFFRLLESGFTPRTRLLAGSVPPGNDDLWNYARDSGYNTDLLRRIENDDGRLVEQGVDEIIHLKIANALLDYDPPQTLVLVTGDGNDSEFGTSFLQQASRALKRGWHVVIWSWKDQLSGKFQRLGGQIQIRHLDQYYKAITYVRGGSYIVGATTVSIGDRVVRKLEI